MRWHTREHWRHSDGRQLWLMEMQDVFSAGWRVEWSWPVRDGQSFSSHRSEQPPDLGAPQAAREALARALLAEKKAECGEDWHQVVS